MSTILTQGIILDISHHKDYDRQYTIYTRDLGKVTAIAKGAKKIGSKLNPHLGRFFVIDLMLANGQIFKRIAAAQIAKNYSSIQDDLQKVIIASYFFEIVDTMIKIDFPDTEVFDIIHEFIFELSIADYKEQQLLALNKFVYHLLKRLGYQPILQAQNQRELAIYLHRLILETGERKINSFELLQKIL